MQRLMQPDFTIAQNDTSPVLTDTLTYSNGQPANLTGATLSLVMRSLASSTPVTLTGTAAIVEPLDGKVSYTFSAKDTATVGQFSASWEVVLGGGAKMRWPTVGYISINIEESLLTPGTPQLVGLPEVKNYLEIPPDNLIHDQKLIGFIKQVQPLIEFETGPIIPRLFDEWYDGGHPWVTLRHRPRTGLNTTPLLRLAACSEYLGPVEWPLAIVSSPDQGQLYSCMVDVRRGRVVRRTAGGGTQPFPYQPQAVHVVYEAGQEQVPENVRLAALETIAWWHSTQQPIGRGQRRPADSEEGGKPSVGLPYHAKSILGPTRRIKGIA
jgi:hypothetical protein